MSPDVNAPSPAQINLLIPDRSKGRGPLWAAIMVASLLAGGVWVWRAGLVPTRLWGASESALETLEVDEGELVVYVTENGSLESANNATVRCEVEAVMGQVGGTAGAQGGARGQQGAQGGGGAAGQQAGQPGAGGPGQAAQPKAAVPKTRPGARKPTAAQAKKSASPTAGSASSTASTQAGGAAPAQGASAAGGGGGAAMGGGAGAAGAAVPLTTTKPVIKSFSLQVAPHVPLRPKAAPQAASKQQAVDPAQLAGGRGGRGGRGGQPQQPEPIGSTRIIFILPEGTYVRAGDVVCELDSATFRDEVKVQKIRCLQAEAWVKQAQSIYDVNQISLREYRDGINPQDRQALRQYLTACETEYDKAKRTAAWSREMKAKGFRTSAQLKADVLAAEQWKMALEEATGMLKRLDKYTGPRLITALKAKGEAIRADLFTQQAAYELERERLAKLEKMVEKCTLTAPRDGIVVYHNQSNRWGRTQVQIEEGATVREGQPIFDLPDPKHMQVRARINETKVNQVRTGQDVLIRLDAFPDRPLRGSVAEVMPISVQGNGLAQDVRVYIAVVKIGEGLDGLRPGLSAEADFHVDTLPKAVRVPLQAVREVAGRTFVAAPVPRPRDAPRDAPRWRWVPVKLGQSNEAHAQVLDGLKPGDKVLAHPEDLPAPRLGNSAAFAQAG